MPATLEADRDLLNKPHGPYRLLAGDHTEDEGRRAVKISKLDGARIEVEGGKVMVIGREGAEVSLDGEAYRLYHAGRRITISELRPGLEVVLAQEVKHQPNGPPFKSSIELDKLHNAFDRRTNRELPNGRKFIDVRGEAGGKEILENDALRKRVAELEAELANRNPPADNGGKTAPNDPPKGGTGTERQQPKR